MATLYDRAMASPCEAFVEATRASQFVSIAPYTTTIGALSASLFMKQQQQKQHGQLLGSTPIHESVRLRLTLGPASTRPRPWFPHTQPSNCQGLLSTRGNAYLAGALNETNGDVVRNGGSENAQNRKEVTVASGIVSWNRNLRSQFRLARRQAILLPHRELIGLPQATERPNFNVVHS